MEFLQAIKSEYVQAFESLNQEVDFDKYNNAIEDKLRFRCKEWFELEGKKVS